MELKTIPTPHVPVRYYEGGAGQPWYSCMARAASIWT